MAIALKQPPAGPVDTLGMPNPRPLESTLFFTALAAVATRCRAHLDGDLAELAERMLRRYRPRAKA